jgi:methionyl aminopeptidase
MMIPIKSNLTIARMQVAGQLLAEVLTSIVPYVKEGIPTLEIDALIEKELGIRKLVSGTKGYMGYRHVACISLNDEVVHGIPSARKILKCGDIVKIDVCAAHQGYFADMARTFLIEPVPGELRTFVHVVHTALNKGIEKAVVGNYLSDISAAIQHEVELHGYGVVRDFAGHGIGMAMHEEPEILNYGMPGRGPRLMCGMALALEPMITMKDYRVYIAHDGWTVKTVDGEMAAHEEDTVIVMENGPAVVTRQARG